MPFGVPDFHAAHIEQGMFYFWRNDFHTALVEFDQALDIREGSLARFDRAHALLALGRYREGFADLAVRHDMGGLILTDTGHRLRCALPQWRGERGRRVVLSHEAGYGDSIMFLRFVDALRARYAPQSIALDMPEPLRRLASQCAPLGDDGDAWCSLFDLPGFFDEVPSPPYLKPDGGLIAYWAVKTVNGTGRRIGIAWSSNTGHGGEHEFQTRSMPLDQFLAALPIQGSLFSLQRHDREEAERLGVHAPELSDFADVAALAASMDVIVSVDTAALHVAGAIGHRNTFAILPFAPTWRWHAGNRWYPNIKLCVARSPGDWRSAFAQI
ncbi:MAG: hypothetical protein J2P55_16680 [Rhizobiales bacterium]|nr:hypothetical protein [Hyphomicrobiales bacterium]